MTTLHLVIDAGGQSAATSARRPASRHGANLKLVADTGGAFRGRASPAVPPRRHSALTLAVAAAAIAAAGLTTAVFDRDSAADHSRAAISIRSLL